MREKINRLSKGIIDAEFPQLILLPERIEEHVRGGETTKSEIFISNEDNLYMKGLLYSSSQRVRVLNGAFGGIRNYIKYEVIGDYLSQGDVIEGTFHLVTNGGEREIPYLFHIETGSADQVLKELKTPEDFGRIAQTDMEEALRLFEHQDFATAPFMQDLHTRTLYDGLKGRMNRHNQLEEFLVGLKVKEPVEISATWEDRVYEKLSAPQEDELILKKNTWGFLQVELKPDGSFIQLSKSTITARDFVEGVCRIPYLILPESMHSGKNLGKICVSTVRTTGEIRIEARKEMSVLTQAVHYAESQKLLANYLALRLQYESGEGDDISLLGQMQAEAEQLRRKDQAALFPVLLQAELYFLQNDPDRTENLLDDCRDRAMAVRETDVELYCYYQYIQYQLQKKDGQRETLVRLIRKHIEQEPKNFLFFLFLKLEPELYENPADLLGRMKGLFSAGCHSPFLYEEAFRIYRQEPGLFRSADSFEMQVIFYGARQKRLGKELALKFARLVSSMRNFHGLCGRILAYLYEQFPEEEILSSICGLLIKGNLRSPREFIWYQKALDAGISLTKLYEYYLYSLPEDKNELLPKEILLYFSYGKNLDIHSRSVLYQNILTCMKPSDPLYKQYEREIEQFAMQQLFDSRIDDRLAVIYEKMIYPNMIDMPVAKILPAILKSCRITCRNERMKYVVVCYEELNVEDSFLLEDGVACVPIFFEHSVILFQDRYGNRYTDIAYECCAVMNEEYGQLEKQCFAVYPGHPMLKLKECRRVLDEGIQKDDDMGVLERGLMELALHPLFRKKMISDMISYENKKAENQEGARENGSYLLDLEREELNRQEREQVCELLIAWGHMKEAYDMIREYGCEGIRPESRKRLCGKMILLKMFNQDELLMGLCYRCFVDQNYDNVILDYLCEHFNGSTAQMYDLLIKGVEERVETYDLEERLLAQMLFSGETKGMDRVFDLYATRKKTGELLVKAYFTVKSEEYFMDEQETGDKVFSYLEGAIHGTIEKDKVPTIYLLALTKYYSSCEKLDEEQKQLCRIMADILMEEGRIFPYFQDLNRHISIPDDIMDKVMIEYHGRKEERIELKVRIIPEEEDFHSEEMRRVYQGIYVKQKALFKGEQMEYRIYELKGESRTLKKEGTVSFRESKTTPGDGRFAALNEMELCLEKKDEGALKKKMEEYVIHNAAVEELFLLL